MYPHTPPSTAELTALRVRLYRPDPPPGAVEAYLDAMRDAVPSERDEPAPRRLRPRRRALAPAAATVALLAVAVMGLGMARQASSATAPPVRGLASAAHLALPSVPGHRIGELYGGPATTGLFDAHGVHAVVGVLCSGDGTIRLRLGQEAPVELTCEAGGPALAMLESAEDLDGFTVSIHPQAGVRWSLAVGTMPLRTR